MKQTPSASRITAHLQALQPLVDSHITVERIRRYVASISSVASPSTAASVLRGPILRELLQETKAFENDNLHFHLNYENTGNSLIFTGTKNVRKKLWYFAHLDTDQLSGPTKTAIALPAGAVLSSHDSEWQTLCRGLSLRVFEFQV